MKVMEHIHAITIRAHVDIDATEFDFITERETSDAIFIFQQVHKKYLGKHKDFTLLLLIWRKLLTGCQRKYCRGL